MTQQGVDQVFLLEMFKTEDYIYKKKKKLNLPH